MIVVPDEGKLFLLDLLLRTDPAEIGNVWLRLFKNDATLTALTVRDDLTESNFSGYSPVELVRADWTAPVINDDRAESVWGDSLVSFFASSGSQDCYGYMVTDADDNFVLWAEKRAAVFSIDPTHPLYLKPIMRLKQQT